MIMFVNGDNVQDCITNAYLTRNDSDYAEYGLIGEFVKGNISSEVWYIHNEVEDDYIEMTLYVHVGNANKYGVLYNNVGKIVIPTPFLYKIIFLMNEEEIYDYFTRLIYEFAIKNNLLEAYCGDSKWWVSYIRNSDRDYECTEIQYQIDMEEKKKSVTVLKWK